MTPTRRAMITFMQRTNPITLVMSHRFVECPWPLTSAQVEAWIADKQAEDSTEFVVLSITWREPEPSMWARFKAWLRGVCS